MAEDIASLSDKIKLEVYNFTLDKNKVEEYKVDKIPAMVVCDGTGKDYGLDSMVFQPDMNLPH